MKVYVPPIGTQLRLLEDWRVAGNTYYHTDLIMKLHNIVPFSDNPDAYKEVYELIQNNPDSLVVPKDSIVQVMRMHVGQSDDRISVKILESPQRLLRKKTVMPDLTSFNTLETVNV